jgi:hypothetical protein
MNPAVNLPLGECIYDLDGDCHQYDEPVYVIKLLMTEHGVMNVWSGNGVDENLH